jgi:uncharacterized protein YegJ (DUF2314 family)
MKRLITVLSITLILVGCSKRPETLVNKFDEKEMELAISKAKSRVDEFISVLQKHDADSFSVKAPIKDENGTEHFWITDVTYENGMFSGLIGNEPGIVKHVKLGQPWRIKKDEISDWMYMRGEKIHGGYTIDPLLATFPKQEAEIMRLKLVR